MNESSFRAIPSVERMLQALGDVAPPRPIVLDVVRCDLSTVGSQHVILQANEVLARIRESLVVGNCR